MTLAIMCVAIGRAFRTCFFETIAETYGETNYSIIDYFHTNVCSPFSGWRLNFRVW